MFEPWVGVFFGDEGIRTPDPLLAKQVLYQLSYIPNSSLVILRASTELVLSEVEGLSSARHWAERAGMVPSGIRAPGPWGHSSVGRALRWQRKGQEFESPCLHQKNACFYGRLLPQA
jgi:hypothetical protein